MRRAAIRSPQNRRVVAAARLHTRKGRQDVNRSLLEGPHLLEVAVDAAVRIDTVFGSPEDARAVRAAGAADAEFVSVAEPVLRRLAGTEHPRGPVAVFEIPDPVHCSGDVVVLWSIGDPGNAGTIIRTGVAFGFGVVATPGTADLWAPKVIRAGAGAHFLGRICQSEEPSLEPFRTAGLTTIAAVPSGGAPPETVTGSGPVAVLIGGEAHGLPTPIIDAADHRVTIPMTGEIESLNAAAAAAVVLYAIRQARR